MWNQGPGILNYIQKYTQQYNWLRIFLKFSFLPPLVQRNMFQKAAYMIVQLLSKRSQNLGWGISSTMIRKQLSASSLFFMHSFENHALLCLIFCLHQRYVIGAITDHIYLQIYLATVYVHVNVCCCLLISSTSDMISWFDVFDPLWGTGFINHYALIQ